MSSSEDRKGEGASTRPLPWRIARVSGRILLWLGLVVVGLVILAWLAVLIFFPDDKIRHMALERVSRETGWQVTSGELDLEIFSGLVLEDVVLKAPAGFSQAPLKVERVVVDYSLTDLLDNRLVVKRVLLYKPTIVLEQRDGQSNLQVLLARLYRVRADLAKDSAQAPDSEEPDEGDPFVLDLNEISLSEGRFILDVPGCRIDLERLAVGARGKLGDAQSTGLQLELQVPLPQGTNLACLPGRPPLAVGLDLKASLDGQGIVDLSGQLKTRGLVASLTGGRSAPEAGGLAVDLEARLDPESESLSVKRFLVSGSGSQFLDLSADLKDFEKLEYRASIERLELSHPATKTLLAGLAGVRLKQGRAWLEQGVVSGGLADEALLRPHLSGDVHLQDVALELSPDTLALSGASGLLKLGVEMRPEQGPRFTLQGQVVTPQLAVAGRQIKNAKLSLKAALALLVTPGGTVLDKPELDLDGSISSARGGGLDLPQLSFGFELRADKIQLLDQLVRMTDLSTSLDLELAKISLGQTRARALKLTQKAQLESLELSPAGVRLAQLASTARASADGLGLTGLDGRGLDLVLDLSLAHLSPAASGSAGAPILEQLRTHLNCRFKQLKRGDLMIAGPGLDAKIRGSKIRLAPRLGWPATVALELESKNLRLGQVGQAGSTSASRMKTSIRTRVTRVDRAVLDELALKVVSSFWDISLDRGEGLEAFGLPGATRVDLAGSLGLARSRISLSSLVLKLGELLNLEAQGRFNWKMKDLELKFATSEHRIESLVAALPKDIRTRMPPLSGGVVVSGVFVGPILGRLDLRHLPFGLEIKVVNKGVAASLPGILSVTGMSGPVTLSAGMDQRTLVSSKVALTIDRVAVPPVGLSASNISVDQATSLVGTELRSDGSFLSRQVDAPEIWPTPVRGVALRFSSLQHFSSLKDPASLLVGLKDLRLTESSLSLGSVGVNVQGHGQVVILPQAKHWSDFRLALKTRTRFAAKESVSMPGGLKARGGADLAVAVQSVEPGVLKTEGQLDFNSLYLSGAHFALDDVSGSIPVSQFIRIRPNPSLLARRAGADPAGGASQTARRSGAYDQVLRPLKGQSRSFLIERARFLDLEFTQLAGNLELNSGVLSLGSLRFGFLDGDVDADTTVAFAPPDARRLSLDAEMSGIDISRLGAFKLAGSSDISGNLRLGVSLKDKDVSAAFNLTRVGRSTLLALLQVADPKDANPGVMKFKNFIKDYEVSPRQVSVSVRHGMVGMRVKMNLGTRARLAARFIQGFAGDTFTLPGLPVGGFMNKYLPF